MSQDTARARAARTTDKADRRAQIIAAAGEVFCHKGFTAARIDDVAERVGVSKPAIYLYFRNKEELLMETALAAPLQALARIEEVRDDPTTPSAEKLERLLDIAYETMVDGPCGRMMPVMAEISMRMPEVAQRFRESVTSRLDAAALAIVREGVARGEFRETDYSDHVFLTVGPIIGIALKNAMYAGLCGTVQIDGERAKAAHLRVMLQVLQG